MTVAVAVTADVSVVVTVTVAATVTVAVIVTVTAAVMYIYIYNSPSTLVISGWDHACASHDGGLEYIEAIGVMGQRGTI